MIKSSKHITRFSNKGKLENLNFFIDEYRRVSGLYLDYIWNNGYIWTDKNGNHEFSISKNLLEFPKYLDYKIIGPDTFLSGRCLSSLVTQICGIIRASVEKQRKRLHMYNKLKSENNKYKLKKLILKIKQNIPQKPNFKNINPELSSKCCDFKEINSNKFNGFLKLHSILKSKINIYIPIKFTKHSNKLLSKNSKMMTSFLIKKDLVNIRWNIPNIEKKEAGVVVGADQGLKDILTFSDGNKTTNINSHGYSLELILLKMSKKKKGSKSFKKCRDHRKNFINWSINNLDISNIKQINLEKIWNIGYKSKTSRLLSHWTNTLIRDKLIDFAELNGVHIIQQNSTYRSQRCSCCGLVRKSNRKGKMYSCKTCGSTLDSDLNAAKNHEIYLPEIPYNLRKLNLNRKGFFWKSDGFYDLTGSEFRVPVSN